MTSVRDSRAKWAGARAGSGSRSYFAPGNPTGLWAACPKRADSAGRACHLPIRPTGDRLGDPTRIVGHDTPTGPALHARKAVVRTAVRSVIALEQPDPVFDPGSEPLRAAESVRPLLYAPLRGSPASDRQHDELNTSLLGQPLSGRRGHSGVTRHEPRRLAEVLPMPLQTLREIGLSCLIRLVARRDATTTPANVAGADHTQHPARSAIG